MTAKARTTHSRASKETVAKDAPTEAGPAEPEATTGAVEGLHADDAPDSGASGDQDVVPPPVVNPPAAKGNCDNHPDRPAVLMVSVLQFPWLAEEQRFCNRCVPASYRYLM